MRLERPVFSGPRGASVSLSISHQKIKFLLSTTSTYLIIFCVRVADFSKSTPRSVPTSSCSARISVVMRLNGQQQPSRYLWPRWSARKTYTTLFVGVLNTAGRPPLEACAPSPCGIMLLDLTRAISLRRSSCYMAEHKPARGRHIRKDDATRELQQWQDIFHHLNHPLMSRFQLRFGRAAGLELRLERPKGRHCVLQAHGETTVTKTNVVLLYCSPAAPKMRRDASSGGIRGYDPPGPRRSRKSSQPRLPNERIDES